MGISSIRPCIARVLTVKNPNTSAFDMRWNRYRRRRCCRRPATTSGACTGRWTISARGCRSSWPRPTPTATRLPSFGAYLCNKPPRYNCSPVACYSPLKMSPSALALSIRAWSTYIGQSDKMVSQWELASFSSMGPLPQNLVATSLTCMSSSNYIVLLLLRYYEAWFAYKSNLVVDSVLVQYYRSAFMFYFSSFHIQALDRKFGG